MPSSGEWWWLFLFCPDVLLNASMSLLGLCCEGDEDATSKVDHDCQIPAERKRVQVIRPGPTEHEEGGGTRNSFHFGQFRSIPPQVPPFSSQPGSGGWVSELGCCIILYQLITTITEATSNPLFTLLSHRHYAQLLLPSLSTHINQHHCHTFPQTQRHTPTASTYPVLLLARPAG